MRHAILSLLVLLLGVGGRALLGEQKQPQFHLSGEVDGANGAPVARAAVSGNGVRTLTDAHGHFSFEQPAGVVRLRVEAETFAPFSLDLDVEGDREITVRLQPENSVVVQGEEALLAPDPALQSYSREELLEANPGRPGVPLSIPGLPTETASSGIKAPQYFAPGVAGDHGEPIAQYLDIGGFLFQNNLSANAHGNGYSDPNIVIPGTLAGVTVDNAGFNARYGDHSINLAVTYDLRPRLARFAQVTTDGRDADLSAGWGAQDPETHAWVALETGLGNGFLARLEERQQHKLNGYRGWTLGTHELTAFGLAYYGFSRIPGLIPFDAPVRDDTLDPRQSDLTHSTVALVTDRWQPDARNGLQWGGYFRTYSLELRSNFGLGLIRQSEWRTVAGGDATYTHAFDHRWSVLAGVDVRRDAPRDLDLAHADAAGVFHLVTSNDLTITDSALLAAVNGNLSRNLQFYLGARRDIIRFDNTDRLQPANSFLQTPGVTSPKATVTLGRPDAELLPAVALSFGKAFHVNDPRIGTGTGRGSLVIQSREYQLVATKLVQATELRLVLAKLTSSSELAKIDPDTGLQQDVGPSVNEYLTFSATRRYGGGLVQASFSKANAVDRALHQPLPEAPRLIVDALGTLDRLPWQMQAKAEYEYVGEKPLGDGFRAVPVAEIQLELERSFVDGRWVVQLNGLVANGHTGQTLETFALPGEPAPFERIVGIPLRSYGGASVVYRFGR